MFAQCLFVRWAVVGATHQRTTPMKNSPDAHRKRQHAWAHALAARVRTLWLTKMLGTSLSIAAFFPIYFWIMQATAYRAARVPVSGLDALIGVQQWAIVPYASLWLYVSMPAAFAANRQALLTYASGALVMVVTAMFVYWMWPTYVEATGIDWSQYPLIQFLKSSDVGGNAFPSLHVAFALFAARVLHSQLASIQAPGWIRWVNGAWCLAIVYATLATRQHVLLDVAGGMVTAWVAVHWVAGAHKLLRAGVDEDPAAQRSSTGANSMRAR